MFPILLTLSSYFQCFCNFIFLKVIFKQGLYRASLKNSSEIWAPRLDIITIKQVLMNRKEIISLPFFKCFAHVCRLKSVISYL